MLAADLMQESKPSRGASTTLHTEVEVLAVVDWIQTMAAHGMVEMHVSFCRLRQSKNPTENVSMR